MKPRTIAEFEEAEARMILGRPMPRDLEEEERGWRLFWEQEASDMRTVLQALSDPAAVTMREITQQAAGMPAVRRIHDWFTDRKSLRQHSRIMDLVGYVAVRDPRAANGLWRVRCLGGARVVVYVKKTVADQLTAARGHSRGV